MGQRCNPSQAKCERNEGFQENDDDDMMRLSRKVGEFCCTSGMR